MISLKKLKSVFFHYSRRKDKNYVHCRRSEHLWESTRKILAPLDLRCHRSFSSMRSILGFALPGVSYKEYRSFDTNRCLSGFNYWFPKLEKIRSIDLFSAFKLRTVKLKHSLTKDFVKEHIENCKTWDNILIVYWLAEVTLCKYLKQSYNPADSILNSQDLVNLIRMHYKNQKLFCNTSYWVRKLSDYYFSIIFQIVSSLTIQLPELPRFWWFRRRKPPRGVSAFDTK